MNRKSTLSKIKDSRVVRVIFARKSVVFCLCVLAVLILASIAAPLVAPYDPYKQDLKGMLQGMSTQHIFGTDAMGRDVLSRIIYGGRVSFTVGLVSVLIAGTAGMILGLIAGMAGGLVDAVIMRVMDAMMSVPMIIMALFLGSIFGKGLGNICLAIGISMIPSYARVTRGQVLTVREMDYVTAGTLCGASKMKNAVSHIFPNCVSSNIVLMTMNLGSAILNEAALSFLGMGINPPTASWGGMVNDSYKYMGTNAVIAIAPGLFIMIVVLCFNMVGDALRDAMDPKLRGTLGKKVKRSKGKKG
ncbi:ABC transporter permease [Parablautia muri]|uniref:ABC transporter permease n=1 Tax=Parablautia muri TaxID=2320879 RepID=A0A9X5BH28_9FIRM|nr:ABC transporter permease [Parablautia muri]NBJ93976.1 ABC transporter permease [Parablautia muri]